MTRRLILTAIGALTMAACVHPTTQFDRYVKDHQWAEAAREFAADTSLHNNENALYQAGLLFATPGRSIYDAPKARSVFTMLLDRFPNTKYADDATGHILLIDEAQHAREAAAARQQELEARIAALTRETQELRTRIDSAAVQSDSLRALVTRLDADRHDKDEQLKALKLELQRLKDIDLKPRPPIKPLTMSKQR